MLPKPRWGLWESAATALVFSLPAAFAFAGTQAPRGALALDGEIWAILLLATGGAFALTLAARGLRDTQAFLMVGVVTCAAWFFAAWALGHGRRLTPCAVLIPMLLAAHYHTVPVMLLRAARSAEGRVAAERLARTRRMILGVVGSVATLDLGLLVVFVGWLLSPERWWPVAGLVWMMAAVAAGGVFTTLAAWKLPRPHGDAGERGRPGEAEPSTASGGSAGGAHVRPNDAESGT